MKNKILGLTGLTGSGKSTVSKYLSEKYNAYIIDADEISRKIMLNKSDCYEEVLANFKQFDILDDNCEINRKKLGQIVFENEKLLTLLTEITHKYIKIEMKKELFENSADNFIVMDAPLLFEADLHKLCTNVWIISSKYEMRLNRIISRDNLDEELAIARMNSRKKLPDIAEESERLKIKIISNVMTEKIMLEQVEECLKELK